MLIRLIILMSALGTALFYPMHGPISAEQGQVHYAVPKRVLVLYPESGEAQALAELHAINIANLAGRHGRADLARIGTYQAGDASGYDAMAVVNTSYGQTVPEALIADAVAGEIPAIWLHYGAAELALAQHAGGGRQRWMVGSDTQAVFHSVLYRGETFGRNPLSAYSIPQLSIPDGSPVEVLAEIRGTGGATLPWAIRDGHLTYIVESPMPFANEDDRYLVFADLFSRMLQPELPQTRKALLRIEDIGPETDPEKLRMMIVALEQLGVPYSVTVYDTYADPAGVFNNGRAQEFSLVHRPQLVHALRDMVRGHGTLVMHGHTHQFAKLSNPHHATSGGDYEFFRAGLDEEGKFRLLGPVGEDSPQMWQDRFDRALSNWDEAGLPRPWLFTFPHYAGSQTAYAAASDRFDARFERVLYFAGEAEGEADYSAAYNDQFFPYPVRDMRGDIILPETLGNWAEPGSIHGRTVEAMLETARRNLVLREAYAGFFYHWYLDAAPLQELVSGLQEMGYEFASVDHVATVIPSEEGEAIGVSLATAITAYQDEITSLQFWMRDQRALVVLGAIALAHLMVFRIGPRRRRQEGNRKD